MDAPAAGWAPAPRPIPQQDIAAAWHHLATRTRTTDAIARVHAPPCALDCPLGGRPGSARCAERLLDEIEADAAAPYLRCRRIRALTLSGGIAVMFSAADLHRLLRTLARALPLSDDCEITVEDPGHALDEEKAAACLEAGARRFDVDVRSFDTALRRRAGLTGAAEAMIVHLSGLADLRGAVVACRLAHGFPDQHAERARRDVQMVLDLGVDGVELRLFRPGAGLDALSLEECAGLYADAARMLEQAGWRQLSNRRWGGPRERSLAHTLTDDGAECLAFGPGADGVVDGHCFHLEEDLDRYASHVRTGAKPVAHMAVLPSASEAAATVRAGITAGWFARTALDPLLDTAARARVDDLLGRWQRAGRVHVHGAVVELTTAGRFWAPVLAAELTAAVR